MKKIKSKIRKLLAVISCAAIISFCFIFNTSALELPSIPSYPSGTGAEIKDTDFKYTLMINLFQQNGDTWGSPISYNYSIEYTERGFILDVTANIINTNNNHYWMIINFFPVSGPATSNNTVTTGSVKIGLDAQTFDIWQSNPYNSSAQPRALTNYSYNGTATEEPLEGTMTYPNTEYTQYCQLNFVQNPDYSYLDSFAACIPFSTYSATNNFKIAFYDYSFKTVSVAQGQTNQIIASNNKLMQMFVECQQGIYNDDINFQSPHQIENAKPGNYAKNEEELLEGTSQGRSEAVGVFNKFGSLFSPDNHLYKGLLATTKIFNLFFEVDWISSLINFSLAIGVFAFIIGTGSSVFRSRHESKNGTGKSKQEGSEN